MEEATITKTSIESAHKTEPLQTSTLTGADFDQISPTVMQDFLIEKIEWLQSRAKRRSKAIIDEVYETDQRHERELVEFLLFSKQKVKELVGGAS